MKKYRTTGHDIAPAVTPKRVAPGSLDEHHIQIFDHAGNARGHVGPKATAAVVSRFTHTADNRLGKKNGKTAWIGSKPKSRVNATAGAKLAAQLRQDKGSNNTTLADVSAQGSATPGSAADTLAGRSSRGATATVVKTGGN